MLDLLIVLCSHRGAMPETIGCLERLKIAKLTTYTAVYAGDALLSRNRSLACTHFLENNWSDYMMFLDDDIVFENRHVEKIYQDLVAGYDIVGGCYPVRDGTQLASFGWDGLLDGKVKEVEYLATGFMGISRKALQKIKDGLNLPLLNPNDWARDYPFFECGRCTDRKGDPIYISEDWDFCEKARKVGLKTYIDTSVQLGHLGLKKYTVADVVEYQKNLADKKDENDKNELLVTHLAEFLGEKRDTVLQHMGNNPSKAMCAAYEMSGLGLTEFYQQDNDVLLYDLAAFNVNNNYMKFKLSAAEEIATGNVLDFGCGIGTAALYLSQFAKHVYGYDVNQKMVKFANFRKEKMGITNVDFHTTLPDDWSDIDLITAFDVFEHIPNLGEVLKDIGSKVKSGTKLLHADSFKHELPVHIDHSAQIDEWLDQAGFIRFDNFRAIKK